MREFRARDTDRDRAVEVIEAAHADGQLGAADRELRVDRARAAQTRDELTTLTRDLRVPQGHGAPATPSASASRSRRVGGVVVGLGVFVALVVAGVTGAVALAFLAVGGATDSVTSQGVEAPVASSPAEEVFAPFELSPATVRGFVRAYEQEFGTSGAFEVSFFPDRVQAQVAVRGSRPRMERWTWDGVWRQDTIATAVIGPSQPVDVRAIDVRRMFANIAAARRTLDVEGARFTHAILTRRSTDPAALTIHVANDFNESGYLSTTASGEVVRRYPYDA